MLELIKIIKTELDNSGVTRKEVAARMCSIEGIECPAYEDIEQRRVWLQKTLSGQNRPRIDKFILLCKAANLEIQLKKVGG